METPTTDTPHGATPPEMLWLAERYEFVEELGRAAVTHARRERQRIVPTSHFVQAWLERHPEERELIAA